MVYFIKNARRRAPKLNRVQHLFSIEPYHTFELNLEEVFSSNDELFYVVDQGYVIGDTLYFEGNERGVFTFNITAHNFKDQSTTFTFQLIVNDDILFFNDSLEEEESADTENSLLDILFRTYEEPNSEDTQEKKLGDKGPKKRKR